MLLFSCASGLNGSKNVATDNTENIRVIITPQWDVEKLDSTVVALSQRNIIFRYSQLKFDSQNNLKAIRIEVDCNDYYSGGASTDNLRESLQFGFSRNYNKDADRHFAVGVLSITGN